MCRVPFSFPDMSDPLPKFGLPYKIWHLPWNFTQPKMTDKITFLKPNQLKLFQSMNSDINHTEGTFLSKIILENHLSTLSTLHHCQYFQWLVLYPGLSWGGGEGGVGYKGALQYIFSISSFLVGQALQYTFCSWFFLYRELLGGT